jgi:hypothetical protein
MLLCFLFSILTHASYAESPSVDGFQSGIRLMQEQKFDEASLQFTNEYKAGKSFAALFYNWGLAEYKLQKRGFALGLWRRALYLDPELDSAHQAIEFISTELPRDAVNDNLEGWAAFRANVLNRASLNKFLILTWLFFVTSAFLLIRYWGARRRALKNETALPKTPTLGITFTALFAVLLFVSIAKGVTLFETRATVISSNTSLRTGPSPDDNSIFDLLEGIEVTVRQVRNSWVQVSLVSGVSGWVPAQALFQHTGRKPLW